MPCQAGLHERYRYILVIRNDPGDEPTISIDVTDHHADRFPEDEARREPFRLGAEVLAGFGTVDPFKADPDFLAVAEDLDRVAVTYTNTFP